MADLSHRTLHPASAHEAATLGLENRARLAGHTMLQQLDTPEHPVVVGHDVSILRRALGQVADWTLDILVDKVFPETPQHHIREIRKHHDG